MSKWFKPKAKKETIDTPKNNIIQSKEFDSQQEMLDYCHEHEINAYSMGYNSKTKKHYFMYKMGD